MRGLDMLLIVVVMLVIGLAIFDRAERAAGLR